MEEKEFAPSKKKLKKAREEGRVARSSELALGLLMLLFFLLLRLVGPTLYRRLKELFSFQLLGKNDPLEAVFPIFMPLIVIMLSIFIFAYLVHVMQIGFIWAWPKRGKKNFHFFLPIIKLVGLLLIFWIFYKSLDVSKYQTIEEKVVYFSQKFFLVAFTLSLFLVLLGILDFIYQKWRFMREMRMTRAEKKEEERN